MNQDKILVIGSCGQVASCLKEIANQNFIFLGRPTFDLCNYKQLVEVIEKFHPKLIINCAAYTAVDQAENEPELAYRLNSKAVEALSIICKARNIILIHLSTDYVFDGNKNSPYFEDDAVYPLSIYGKSKADGEMYIRNHLRHHIILRTSWVFSFYGTNFVKTMLRLMKEKDSLNIVNDQIGCPTSAGNIAKVIMNITEKILNDRENIIYGTYHYTDKPALSWFEFAEKIFELIESKYNIKVPIVKPISCSQYFTSARRPINSILDCSLINKNFGVKQYKWTEDLENCIGKLL